MQVATLTYPSDSKSSNPSKTQLILHRNVFAALVNPGKGEKARRSFHSDVSRPSNVSLPPVKTRGKRSNSIRVDGIPMNNNSKLTDASTFSFRTNVRSRSQQSNHSETRSENGSRSGTPSGVSRSFRLKFGHPVKFRSSSFYGPTLTETELRLREESFVNDAIRTAHRNRKSSIIRPYDQLNDPHLNDSRIVNKHLDAESRKRTITKNKHPRALDYLRIVAKKSSGYGKLNGYDCIPAYARRYDRFNASSRQFQTSANSSLRSFSTKSIDNKN